MADTRREKIITQVEAALDGPGKPVTLVTVERDRERALTPDEMPALIIYTADENETQHEYGAGTQWDLLLAVEVRLSGSTEPASSKALDPYLSWIVKALRSDSVLKSMVDEFGDMRTEWAAALRQQGVMAGARVLLPFRFHTMRNNPEIGF